MTRARFDRSAGMDVPKANRHVATARAEHVSVRTETDVQNRFRVTGNRIGASRHRIHTINGQRLVLDDRDRFATLALGLTDTSISNKLSQRFSHICGDLVVFNVECKRDGLLRLDELVQQSLELLRSGVAGNINLRALALSLASEQEEAWLHSPFGIGQ